MTYRDLLLTGRELYLATGRVGDVLERGTGGLGSVVAFLTVLVAIDIFTIYQEEGGEA